MAKNNTDDSTPKVDESRTTAVDEISVYTAQGAFVRTYSRADHGAEFRDKAAQYASKIKGVVK
ncbi:hypothetical protein [Bradyrhizobium elkanii]|uniref:hypothetical protein n=1 Tax=Bradyrhizobium elkanii TaxID=29448 RepID=UPI003D23FC55